MKKIFLLLLVFAGCAVVIQEQDAPPETIRNPECLDVAGIEIRARWDSGIWANLCRYSPSRTSWHCDDGVNRDVFLVMDSKRLERNRAVFADGETARFEKDECLAADGTHTYTTLMGSSRTIRRVKIIDSSIPNPAFADQQYNEN